MLAGVLAACARAQAGAGEVPPPQAPPAELAQEVAAAPWYDVSKWPFIPIPEIDTAPNSGVTVGLLPVMLSNNAQGQIDRILAPDIIHSEYFGWGARWRTFRYPSEDERWSLVAGAKQYVEREFDFEYDLGLQRTDRWSWIAHAMYDRSGTGRFYGLGNDSLHSNQTTYINSQIRLEATAARNFTPAAQLAYLLRADTAEIEQSALDSLPSIMSRYPRLNGVGDVSEVQQRLVWSLDTRDSVVIPRRGERLALFAGFASKALGGSTSYAYYGADGTALRPLAPELTLVGHAALRLMPSATDAPFWALSSVGGESSVLAEAQPLRAYGAGRYVDRNSFSASIEVRDRVRSMHFFDTDIELELAPFVDSGKVYSAMEGSPLTHLHAGGGLGIRMIASPYVVGYLDVAHGSEGYAVFSGINYPF